MIQNETIPMLLFHLYPPLINPYQFKIMIVSTKNGDFFHWVIFTFSSALEKWPDWAEHFFPND